MPQDVNDMGATARQLTDAARDTPPIGVTGDADRSILADKGKALVVEVMDRIELAQDKQERVAVLNELMSADHIPALHMFYWSRKVEWRAQFNRLAPFQMVTMGRELEKLVRDHKPTDSTAQGLQKLTGIKKLTTPPGYVVDERGVWMVGDDSLVLVAASPVIVSAIAREPGSSVVRLQLSWKMEGKWARKSVDRYHAMDGRSLTRLASDGFPVHSGNCGELVKYLAAFESHNAANMPRISVTTHMGWTGDDFMWGTECLTGDMRITGDDGLMQRAKGYHSGGTWEEWQAACSALLCPSPLAMLGVYVAACAPLLHLMDAPGFVFDLSGETSHGKSTVMGAWSSVWGDPSRVVGSWASSSTVGPTITAWFLHSLPVMLDDTKRGREDVIGRMMYDIPAGQEQMKGSADGGLRELKRWHTLLISNGEAPITSFTQDGGAHARCLCVQGAPIHSGEQARGIDKAFSEHFGHLGPRVLLKALEDPSGLRERYRKYRDHYAATASSNVEGRMSAYVAAIRVAADLCSIAGCPHPQVDPIEFARTAMMDGAASSDKPREAMEALMSWAVTHRGQLWGFGVEAREPHMGWAGIWKDGEIGVTSAALDRIMAESGFRTADIVKGWVSRGWLEPGKSQRRIAGKRARLHLIPSSVVSEFTDIED